MSLVVTAITAAFVVTLLISVVAEGIKNGAVSGSKIEV